MVNQAIVDTRMLEIDYYKENEDEFTAAPGSSPTP